MAVADRLRLGVDVGGTFTDLVLHDSKTGSLTTGKILTTPADPSVAILEGAAKLLSRNALEMRQLGVFIHATTLVTNTIIERKGARTALLTTRGFRDVIEMGTETRYDIYDLGIELPVPLVPRELRREINERIDASGAVLEPLDEADAEATIAELVRSGVEAIAVCLLHAYTNPAHEQALKRLITEKFHGIAISISSEIQPEIREFERASTTVANAYVQPKVTSYLRSLEASLSRRGFDGRFHIMLSSGGLTDGDIAARFPIKILESGPAAGVEAARALGAAIDKKTLVSFDMGGTTAKIGLVNEGVVALSSELEVARLHRFKKGSGLVVKAPTVELIEIGAGGGSIAWVDAQGLLKVGPRSAGAEPGPACYGRGGDECTVTDADLVLGYLDPEDFAGKEMKLDLGAAQRAVGALAERMGLTPLEVAWGVHNIANENMATAARIHLVEKGKDPSAFTFVAFGGAGPLHAQGVARKIGVTKVIVPRNAGVMSAVGLLVAPMSFEVVRSQVGELGALQWENVNAMLENMEKEARQYLRHVPNDQVVAVRTADMRYRGQGSEVAVRLPDGTLSAAREQEVVSAFHRAYDELYGRHLNEGSLEFVSFRMRVLSRDQRAQFQEVSGGRADGKPTKTVKAYFAEASSYLDTHVYAHDRLKCDIAIQGPAIVRSTEFSALVGPRQQFQTDFLGNLLIDL